MRESKNNDKIGKPMPSIEHIKSIKEKLCLAKEKYEKDHGLTKPLTAYSLHKLLVDDKDLPSLAISALQKLFDPDA